MIRKLIVTIAALSLFVPVVLADPPAYTVSVAPDAASYSSAQVATGEASITVTLVDAEGAPVAHASVSATIIRQPWVSNAAREVRVSGLTGEDGAFTFAVPVAAAAPGTYRLLGVYTGAGQFVGNGLLAITPV